MDKLFTLLELQHRAQEAQSREALVHIITNETIRIISYTQAVFFSTDAFSVRLEKISGNAILDSQSIYAADIKKAIKNFLEKPAARVIQLSPETHRTSGAISFFRTGEEGMLGGLWLENGAAYNEAEIRILEELSLIYAQSLALWELRSANSMFSFLKGKEAWKKYAALACIILALFPVRLTISAPTEIIAKQAEIVTAPFDGIIEKITVEPGDVVKKEDVLVIMENQSLQAQTDMAEQEILIAQSALSRMQRESLSSPEKKTNLVELQEDIEAKKIARDYAQGLKGRSEVKSSTDGVAVFSGSHPLEGKPVHTGEKIMMIADPSQYELLIRVPVDAMITIPKNSTASFFLNISPLSSHDGKIRSIGYQPSPDPDGLITYKVLAEFADDTRDMRIGWKGTAHIKGEWTILSLAILRRPVVAFRNLIGV